SLNRREGFTLPFSPAKISTSVTLLDFPSLTAPRRFLSHTPRTYGALNGKCANASHTSACIRHGASG
ncbi:MAG: hypothetical protein OXI10_13880, partial [Gammaproteobacteria bacterium]|nr:hypothetical protein [Gammaproteobacteria bacterium]